MAQWRLWVGMLLILLPLLCLAVMVALGILLGSMGMDIHWKSKAAFRESHSDLRGLADVLVILL